MISNAWIFVASQLAKAQIRFIQCHLPKDLQTNAP